LILNGDPGKVEVKDAREMLVELLGNKY